MQMCSFSPLLLIMILIQGSSCTQCVCTVRVLRGLQKPLFKGELCQTSPQWVRRHCKGILKTRQAANFGWDLYCDLSLQKNMAFIFFFFHFSVETKQSYEKKPLRSILKAQLISGFIIFKFPVMVNMLINPILLFHIPNIDVHYAVILTQ